MLMEAISECGGAMRRRLAAGALRRVVEYDRKLLPHLKESPPMFNKGQLAGLMKQAQAMQDNLKKAQEELAHIEVEGESGAGLVKVLMTAKHDVKRVKIGRAHV